MNRTEQLIAETDRYLAHNYHPLPVVFTKAKGVWYWDVEGKKIMDMLAGYSAGNHGHCHPRIVKALKDQCQRLVVAPRSAYSDKLAEFGRVITEFCGMDKILPSNGGVDAVETAIKLSRKWGYTYKGIEEKSADSEIIVCSGNFHGRTTTVVGFSTESQYRKGFGPFAPGFNVIEFGNSDALEKAITRDTVAFLVEPIQGEGGINIPPSSYFREVELICREKNILLILDEIQTGFGRTGYDFAFQHENIRPDILIIGKSLGGGMAVSGVLASNEIMSVMTPGDHGSTFGGNPLACAVAIEAINVLKDEELSNRSALMGDYFKWRLKAIKSPLIKEVRGRGLMIGVELTPQAGGARRFCEALLNEGIFCKETRDNIIRFTPPLIITQSQIDWAMKRIEKVFQNEVRK
ncbi:MAG: Acetylornithine aminotransferase [Candidatus Yanofskybacteria bacterium GW2011_GWA1_39_13]|uniref:ornithine aminotransferase n=1 Tax=Yanofskybacteria sp. (strain GW2011_GWA1_39_13) TaxID=1619019 RepID=A0A0G0MPW6_YANXG|nr:MAG: Acetylornithine aminotransferase [Candidatus Yanofskybacteria bacterium GW2011_GWA1_39_13]